MESSHPSDGKCNGGRTPSIRELAICAHVDDAVLDELEAIATAMRFNSGDVIIAQKCDQNSVFVITDGLVKLYRETADGDRQITGFLGTEDVLGGIKRTSGAHCTAEAITDTVVCAFPRKKFLSLVEANSSLCFNLLFAATDEIEAQSDHITLLGCKRAPARLATFMLLLAHRWGVEEKEHVTLVLPLSRSDIADYLGLTVETISRTFAQFRQAGLIELLKPNVIYLNRVPTLYAMAGFDELPATRVGLGL